MPLEHVVRGPVKPLFLQVVKPVQHASFNPVERLQGRIGNKSVKKPRQPGRLRRRKQPGKKVVRGTGSWLRKKNPDRLASPAQAQVNPVNGGASHERVRQFDLEGLKDARVADTHLDGRCRGIGA